MGPRSVRALVQSGDISREQFFFLASEVAIRKLDSITEFHHLAEKIGSWAETLEYFRYGKPFWI